MLYYCAEVQRNKLHVMIFNSKSMDKKLNEKFKIGRNRFISHRRANANWQKTKQRKIIIWWKYCVNSNLILAAKKAIVERKMRKRMVCAICTHTKFAKTTFATRLVSCVCCMLFYRFGSCTLQYFDHACSDRELFYIYVLRYK